MSQSQYNSSSSYKSDGRENMLPPFPPPPFAQPTFLTLQEVESRQFAQGIMPSSRNASSHSNKNRNQSMITPMVDVRHSNLQATAQEFQPGAIYPAVNQSSTIELPPPSQSLQHTGAVRRNNQYAKNAQPQPQPQPQQQRSNNRNKERKPPKEKEKLDNNYTESRDEQLERKQSTGHNRERRKVPREPSQGQGQTRYNQSQNQNQNDTGNSYNNYNGNKFRNNRSSYQRERERENVRDIKDKDSMRDQEQTNDVDSYRNGDRDRERPNYRDRGDYYRGDASAGTSDRDNFRERKSYRDNRVNRENPSDNRDNRDRDNYKDHWRSGKSYERSSFKNWRERPSNTKTSVNTDDKPTHKFSKDFKEDKATSQSTSSNNKVSKHETLYKKKLDAASQRERLEHMVNHRMIECLVCCEQVRSTDKVWSCKQCFHILHLSCVQKWAKSSKLESGWRCPACQNVLTAVPTEYRCYCDKYAEPKFEPGLLAHSCGEVCRRSGRNCEHTCTLLCHPGPCPDCIAMVPRACGCGATKATVKCNSNLPLTCEGVCNKLLNCELHSCAEKCHWEPCKSCTEMVKQECFCGKQGRKVTCVAELKGAEHYACDDICGKVLSCGNHKCTKVCHSGDCSRCPSDPDLIKTCPCGKKSLSIGRISCLDPIPCCDKVCGKVLDCGQPNKPHRCEETCHNDECPQCPATTMVRCRCGHMYKEIACRDLTTKADDARCQKKCTKMRMCSKHKCNQYCCIEVEHRCPMLCNRNLSCGLHRCESNCHSGRCEPCWHTSFEELYCECGASVIYPPVPCGTRAPTCTKQCSRLRPCGHEPHHNCHTGPCPPCTLFTTKLCHGGHESRGTIPCHQEDFSCGMPCNKDMPCGQHRCIQVCHKGPCPQPCSQPCTLAKRNCEHLCNRPCHTLPCPTKSCKQTVVTTCQCGLRSSTNICMNMVSEYQKIAMVQLAAKMADMTRGQAIDIPDIANKQKKGGAHKILECTDDCRLVERNRRMAIGLQIRNPDLSAKLTPRYTDYLKQWAKKDPRFCQSVHEKLSELVQLAKQSKQKSRSHSFECMNREKRHFVHELCEHFGIESAAYDAEPNRNVVATASKEKSWLPSCSLIELIQRENGQRKVPGPPVRNLNVPSSGVQQSESVSLRLQSGRTTNPSERAPPATPPGEYIDYFDNPP